MKNIGYIYVKDTYPENYRDITLVFNDVDTMPKKQNALDYKTVKGNIKHFYGFEFTLGGIVSITAGDFEDLGGFPNFWCWGFEDNYLQKKAKTNKINIDRTTFYDIGSKEIIHLKDDIEKPVNKIEHEIFKKGVNEGFKNITDLDYYFIDTTGFLNVKHFNTDRKENPNYTKMHNVTQSRVPFNKRGALMNMRFT